MAEIVDKIAAPIEGAVGAVVGKATAAKVPAIAYVLALVLAAWLVFRWWRRRHPHADAVGGVPTHAVGPVLAPPANSPPGTVIPPPGTPVQVLPPANAIPKVAVNGLLGGLQNWLPTRFGTGNVGPGGPPGGGGIIIT